MSDHAHLCGWIDYAPAREAIAATFPGRTLALAAPHLMVTASDRHDVFLYRAWKDVLGKYPDYVAQEIGDCTSFGCGHACDLTQCVEIVAGEAEEYHELCTEAIYGMGREIGNMLGRGDGCYGVAVAKAVCDLGVVPRDAVGPYSGQRAKEWGRTGVPAEMKQAAAAHKFGQSTLITTLEEADAAIDNGYVAAGGGMEAFAMTRDAAGICRKTWGSWAHEMITGAGRKRIGGAVYYLYCQSWGPNTPDGPTPDDMPDFSFWVHEDDHVRRLARGDTVAVSKFDGFPARNLPSHWTNRGWF